MSEKRTTLSTLLDEYQDYLSDGLAQLAQGEVEYDGSAEHRPAGELVQEILAECVDTSVWAYLLYRRVKALSAKVARLEESVTHGEYVAIDVDDYGHYCHPGDDGPCHKPCPSCSCHVDDPDE